MGVHGFLLVGLLACLLGATRSQPRDINMIVAPGGGNRSQLNFVVGFDAMKRFSFVQNRKYWNILHLNNKSGAVMSIYGNALGSSSMSLLEEEHRVVLSEAQRARFVHAERKRRLARMVKRLVPGARRRLLGGADATADPQGKIDKSMTVVEKALEAAWKAGSPANGKKATPLADAVKIASGLTVTGAIMSTPEGNVEIGPDSKKVKQWKLLYEDDFHKGSVEDWVRVHHVGTKDESTKAANREVSTCAEYPHPDSDYFLGAFGNIRVRRVYPDMPAHDFVRVTARVHFIDKWNGEYLYMDLDGKRKWTKTHRYCTDIFETQCNPSANGDAKAINSCGNPNFADTLSIPIDVSFRHVDPVTGAAGTSLKLELGADLSMGACNPDLTCPVQGYGCSTHGLCINSGASWGLDDVRVYVM